MKNAKVNESTPPKSGIEEKELRAYLHQQLQKLEPHIKVQGRISFEEVAKAETDYQMRLVYMTPMFQLEADGVGDDAYTASADATEKMIVALADIENIVGDELFEETAPEGYELH